MSTDKAARFSMAFFKLLIVSRILVKVCEAVVFASFVRCSALLRNQGKKDIITKDNIWKRRLKVEKICVENIMRF